MAEPDPAKRPSRRGWPLRTQPTTTSAGTHEHELPAWVFRAVILQAAGLLILGVAVGVLLFYILGRGAYRDQQQQQVREQIRESWCTALDALPEGGRLDQLRETYGCGPGIPLEDLPPDEANRIREQRGENPAQLDEDHVYVPPTQPVNPMGGATAEDPYGAPTYGPPSSPTTDEG